MEGVFVDRVFIVYKPTGLLPNRQHRDPNILNTVKIVDFKADHMNGCKAIIKEANFGQEMVIGHVPRKLFDYPIYISIPPRMALRWDVKILPNGLAERSLSFAMWIKTKNKSSFYSQGNVYAETPNKFRGLYPAVAGEFRF